MFNTAPEKVVAFVVGIDHYEYGEPWSLAGPAADALRCVNWLLDRGVLPANIALFLSTRSIQDDPEMAAWVVANPACAPRPATRSHVHDFIDKELPSKKAEALFVFWGGHGVADDFEEHNYLYTEDAAEHRPYCVSLQRLTANLRGRPFSHLTHQIVIVDACANPYSDTGEFAKPSWAHFANTPIDHDIWQLQMFAATRGKIAVNVSERRSGLFSGALFDELKRSTESGWPDFIAAFDATISGVEKLGLATQQPYMLMHAPGRSARESGVVPGPAAIVTSLLEHIRNTAASPALLHHLYLCSLPDQSRGLDSRASREQWLRDLDDVRSFDAHLPPPIVQFAERLARKLSDATLAAWVDDRTHSDTNARDALRSRLDAEAATQRPRATLFIELPEHQDELHWWVHSPNPKDCSRRESMRLDAPLNEALAARLPGIVAAAESTSRGVYNLVIGLILPDTLLLAQLESLKVDFDGTGRLLPLNRRYPVSLHWRTRVFAAEDEGNRPLNGWRQALKILKPRLSKGGGADVLWLRASGDDDELDPIAEAWDVLTRASSTAICVGVGHPGASAGPVPAVIRGCLAEGVPCFFWLAHPPPDELVARQQLCDIFARLQASETPLSLGQQMRTARRGDALSLVRIVWDEPGHLPPTPTLRTPGSNSEEA